MSLITNIQRYSIHDGDGIRTTIFFKGCPLKCVWCHNPETQRYKKDLLFNSERCTGCGRCADVCPEGAISLADGLALTDTEKCTLCGACADVCFQENREIMGRDETIKGLLKEALKDQMFFEESGGGVTLSGGEVMTQDMDFVEGLLRALSREGISVAIDTCGYAPWENFERVFPYVDTFLYDVKVLNDETHKKYIGVSNALILENLRKLSRKGARIFIRIPVIKEVNGTEKDMKDIITFLKDADISAAQVNLLPYHNTGKTKYARLGKTYGGEDLHAPDKEEMKTFQEMFIANGYHNTKIGG